MGPGKIVGAVTQIRYRTPSFKLTFSKCFLCVGLCSHTILMLQVTWRHGWCQIHQRTCAISDLSEVTYLSFGDAWRHKERPILIRRMTWDSSRTPDHEDLHQRIFIGRWIAIERWTLLTIRHTRSGDRDRPLT